MASSLFAIGVPWHTEAMTTDRPDVEAAEQEILDALAEYRAAPAVALARRDERIREAAAKAGLRQVDVIKLTGLSREAVRQALNPEARAAVKQAAEQRRAAQAERPTPDGDRASDVDAD